MFHRVAAVCIILALTCNLCAATGSFDIQLERVSYSVVEGNTVEVCVLLTDVVALNREANLTVQFTGAQPMAFTVALPDDSTVGSLVCTAVTAPDNLNLNEDETGVATLFTVDTDVNVMEPLSATIQVVDNEVAFVQLTETEFHVNETAGFLDVCLSVSNLMDETLRPIVIYAFTEDGTATGGGTDFDSVMDIITFPIGTENGNTTCFRVDITNDEFVEKNEYFTVGIRIVDVNVLVVEPSTATVHIYDDDELFVSFNQTVFTVDEGAGEVLVCAELSGLQANTMTPLWVDVSTMDNTALMGDDYDSVMATLSFPAGSSNGSAECIIVPIIDNMAFEKSENFSVSIGVVEDNIIIMEPSTVFVTIEDDEVVYVSFAQSEYNVSEGDGASAVLVQLTNVTEMTQAPIWVTLESMDGELAISGEDFGVTGSLILSFPAGSNNGDTQSLAFMIIDDDNYERDHAFTIHIISTEENVLISGIMYTTVNIEDNEEPMVAFTQEEFVVSEADGQVEVCVVASALSALSEVDISVDYMTSPASADSADFVDSTGTLTIPPGTISGTNEATQCVNITIVDNMAYEKDEYFLVEISSDDSGVMILDDSSTVNITDDEMVNITFTSNEFSGSETSQVAQIVLQLQNTAEPTQADIWVGLSVSDAGTAVEGDDFSSAALDSVVIPIGSVDLETFPIDIAVNDDGAFEKAEYFVVNIDGAEDRVGILNATTTVTIQDNEMLTVNFTQPEYFVDEDGGFVMVCLQLNGVEEPTQAEVWAPFYARDGELAADGLDFQQLSSDSQFFPTESEDEALLCQNLIILDDDNFEKTHNFSVHVNTTGLEDGVSVVDPAYTTITITDNEEPVLAFTMEEFLVGEADGQAMVCVQATGLTDVTEVPIWLDISAQDGSAMDGSDYQFTPNPDLAIPSGTIDADPDSTQCINITIFNDLIYEKDEYFSVHVASEEEVSIPDPYASVNISDDEELVLQFTSLTHEVEEGAGALAVMVEVTGLGDPPAVDIWFALSAISTGSPAIEGDDYALPAQDPFIPADSFSTTVNISIVDDLVFEKEHDFQIALVSNEDRVTVSVPSGTATVTILDNEAPEVNFDQSTYSMEEGVGSFVVCVVVSNVQAGLETELWIGVTSADMTASSEMGGDYLAVNYSNSFLPMSTVDGEDRCFNVTILDDQAFEKTETFYLLLEAEEGVTIGDYSPALVEIMDDDEVDLGFVQDTYDVDENAGFVMVCVVLNNVSEPTQAEIWVNISSVSYSATMGDDFMAVDEALYFAENSTNLATICLNVTILDDLAFEKDEHFFLYVVSEPNVNVMPNRTRVNILEDEDVMVGFAQAEYTVEETDGFVMVCLVLTGVIEPTETEIWLDVSAMDDSAVDGEDYNSSSLTDLFFPEGSINNTMLCRNISILDDLIYELDHSFSLHIGSLEEGVTPDIMYSTVTIIDNEQVELAFGHGDLTVNEEDGVAMVCVVLAVAQEPLGIAVSFTLETEMLNATADDDYVSLSDSFQFPVGSEQDAQVCANVSIEDDGLQELLEAFIVTLNSTMDGVSIENTDILVFIVDNDVALFQFTNTMVTASEGESAVLMVELAQGNIQTVQEIVITVTTMNGEAEAGTDYTAVTMDLTFPAGTMPGVPQQVAIPILEDSMLDDDETFMVMGSSSAGGSFGDPATVTIPANGLDFTGDTPNVNGNDVTVMFNANAAVMAASCSLNGGTPVDCTSGSVTITGDGTTARQVFDVDVTLVSGALLSLSREIRSDNNDFCDVHLINTGVTINEDRTATFTFEGTGPSEITDFRCSDFITSGRQNFVDCTSPYTTAVLPQESDQFTFRVRAERAGPCDGPTRSTLRVDYEF